VVIAVRRVYRIDVLKRVPPRCSTCIRHRAFLGKGKATQRSKFRPAVLVHLEVAKDREAAKPNALDYGSVVDLVDLNIAPCRLTKYSFDIIPSKVSGGVRIQHCIAQTTGKSPQFCTICPRHDVVLLATLTDECVYHAPHQQPNKPPQTPWKLHPTDILLIQSPRSGRHHITHSLLNTLNIRKRHLRHSLPSIAYPGDPDLQNELQHRNEHDCAQREQSQNGGKPQRHRMSFLSKRSPRVYAYSKNTKETLSDLSNRLVRW